jgi:hypothetical protein
MHWNISKRLIEEGKHKKFKTTLDQESAILPLNCLDPEFAADITLWYRDTSGRTSKPVLIQEVGFMESYSELVQSFSGWFQRLPDLKVAVLVKIDETPNYKNPLLKKAVFDDSNFAPPTSLTQSDVQLQDPANPNGPLRILGFTWVGELTAFVEIWVRDPGTGKPVMRGQRIVSFAIFNRKLIRHYLEPPHSFLTLVPSKFMALAILTTARR